ncbi:brachyurin [Tribolium castaneum]|uniref:Serine protease P127 n=1 Tax=Tribolium castaneum TaxID=7070 RepID=D6WZJ8_TRICA|nr:PREDICTED: brachyurin [Tribolium castaneum]EFA10697.1 serine protease P127 [Tribolium castaneum]|eukprot:XP_008198236.1 PREDICTED: brachyurin [Tribolium castaneum]
MKASLILILGIVALAAAAPKPTKLNYRNLYKPPVGPLKHRPSPKIIGGHEATPHSIPYQAFLEVYSGSEGWYCGGSLISQNYVLTAGHCGVDATEAHVTLGAHKPLQDEDTQVKIVSKDVKVHEQYNAELIINDVAVIKLPKAVTFTDAVKAVALPSKADANNTFEGETARISGWGLTDGFDNKLSEVLNYVDVKVISNAKCGEAFGDLKDSIVCTSGDENTGSCNGDSGGPLAIDDVQIGVVSFGIMYCLSGYPSAFSRVTSFLDWIATNSDVVIN